MKLANVWIEHRTLKLNQTFTYRADQFSLERGVRVRVNFNNTSCIAFVQSVEKTSETAQEYAARTGYALKDLESVIDEHSLLTNELFDLGLQLAKDTVSPIISCFQTMLPKMLNPRSSSREPVSEVWIQLVDTEGYKLNTVQQEIVDRLRNNEGCSLHDLKEDYGSRIDTLVKKGILEKVKREVRYHIKPIANVLRKYPLSEDQIKALDAIRKTEKEVICLYGPTGSGKTEIYLELADEAMRNHRQALILVPEISLTPQMVQRVQERFGQDVIIYHSGLNDSERYQQYQRVKDGENTVVVGTRSAIWLPFQDLALIVLDEEHDNSYKQDSLPRYHCRDVAVWRAGFHGCKVVLGSATPSFETYARAKKGVYDLIELPERVSGVLPKVKITPPGNGFKNGTIGKDLADAIRIRLDLKQQIVLLLNRRGYSPVMQCISCGATEQCTDCDRPMSVHKDENVLKCHSCGITRSIPTVCSVCGSTMLRNLGVGTQRIEEELNRKFPNTRITRMDSDTTSRKNGHRILLDQFAKHETDILLGTQMIAKGLDIPNVTLVGILGIDTALMRTDYRSVEEAFDLLVQAAGRSGRGDVEGEVIIQSKMTDHYALKTAVQHEYKRFFVTEMNYRKLGQNPPYQYLIAMIFSSSQQEHASEAAEEAAVLLRNQDRCKVLGPSDLGKTARIYRNRLLIKGRDLEEMRSYVRTTIETMQIKSDIDISVDVNPLSIL